MTKRCIKLSTVQRLRGGPVEPFLDGFAKFLLAQGYRSVTRASYLRAAAHLGEWTSRCGSAITAFDEALLARFVRHLPECRCRGWKRGGHKRVPFRVQVFLRYLRGAGVVTTSAPEPTLSPLVTEYRAWMRDQRGLSAMTITHSLPVIQALLDTVAHTPASLDAGSCSRTSSGMRRRRPAG